MQHVAGSHLHGHGLVHRNHNLVIHREQAREIGHGALAGLHGRGALFIREHAHFELEAAGILRIGELPVPGIARRLDGEVGLGITT